jgi:Plasmid pRiA4b ORF-3-like protein
MGHQILLEEIVACVPSARYPMVLTGRGGCPPEDVGGVSGYYHFLNVMNVRRHSEHDDMLEWVGGKFDPPGFNAHDVNRAFHCGWGPRRPDA